MADQNFRIKRGLEVGVGRTILYADPGGSVGIGTTNPTQKLDVAGNVAIGGSVYDNNDLPGTNGQVLSNVTGFGVSWSDAPTGEVNVNEISSGSYYIGAFETTGTTAQAYIETTNPVVLTSDGNIGIGTTNATSTLTVVGDVNVSGLSTFRDYLRVNDNNSDSRLYVGSGPSSDQALLRHTNGFSYLYHYGNDTFHIALAAGSANKIQFDTISKKMCEMYRNGSVNLYYDGSEKFETTNTGVTITGGVSATGGTNAIGIQSGGLNISTGIITALNFVGAGNTFSVNGSTVDISIAAGSDLVIVDGGDFNSSSSTAGANSEINGGEFT